MNWLLLVGLCIIWGAFLLPSRKRAGVSATEFERNLKVLAEIQEPTRSPGRWVLMPRADERFVGKGSRARARAREHRRRVFTVLGEGMGFTALIGAFPPLRPMWIVTAIFAGLLGAYVVLLLRLKATRGSRPRDHVVTLPEEDVTVLRPQVDDATGVRPARHRAAAR